MEISRTPTATWQDLLAVGGVLLGYAAMNAENTLFLAIYLSMGAACLILAVRSHKELTTTWRIGLYLFVLVTTAVLGYRTYYKNEQRELDSNAGLLAPAGDALPLSNCPIPFNAFVVYYAGSAFRTNNTRQIIIGNKQENLLSIERSPAGTCVT